MIESDLPPSADTPPAPEEPSRTRSSAKSILEWLGVILGALLVALLIKTFLLQAFYIPSRSMEPTLRIGDRVLVNKLSYKMHDINRGDIVVFERPPDEPPDAIKDLIKRVIALPGETISSENGHVFIDGRPLEEPYLEPGTLTENLPPTLVPEGQDLRHGRQPWGLTRLPVLRAHRRGPRGRPRLCAYLARHPPGVPLILVAGLRCASGGSCSLRSTIGASRTRAAHCAAH